MITAETFLKKPSVIYVLVTDSFCSDIPKEHYEPRKEKKEHCEPKISQCARLFFRFAKTQGKTISPLVLSPHRKMILTLSVDVHIGNYIMSCRAAHDRLIAISLMVSHREINRTDRKIILFGMQFINLTGI